MPTKKVGRPAKIDREQLLDVAEKLFSESGFDGTTIRQLAKAAHCNLALISYYFGGKEGLYEGVLLRHLQGLRDRYSRAQNEAEENREELRKSWPEFKDPVQARFCSSIYTIASYIITNRQIQKILCREMMSGGKRMALALSKSESGLTGVLQETLSGLKKSKYIGSDLDTRYGVLSIMGPIVYTCVASPVLKDVYGFKNLDETYIRNLSVHLTQTLFHGWIQR